MEFNFPLVEIILLVNTEMGFGIRVVQRIRDIIL